MAEKDNSKLSFKLQESLNKLIEANHEHKKEIEDLCKEHNGFQSYVCWWYTEH